ncbi:MAG TPA: ABC transporter permease [Acidimicrobiales bacterium]|nr:ABC transporter permease [Acidimicrobiales bacterium]
MRGLRGAARLQFQIVRADRGYLNEILANPFFAIIFLGIVRAAGRRDLTAYAVVAPVLITLWGMALEISGDIVDSDRGVGILEGVVATPVGFPTVVSGRVLAVTLLSGVAIVETWLVARIGFGVDITVHHPWALLATVVVTGLAAAGTAVIMAGVFVLARTAKTFQNSLNYPIFLLAGVIVPLSFLPGWLRPVGRMLFLSWSADLLRESLAPAAMVDVIPRLGIVLALGAAGLVVGRAVMHVVLTRVRILGTLSFE